MVAQGFIKEIDNLNKGKVLDFKNLELKKIIEEYPCFHSAFLMQAIALKQESEEAFQENLPSIATRVLNRAVLYDRVTFNYKGELTVLETEEKNTEKAEDKLSEKPEQTIVEAEMINETEVLEEVNKEAPLEEEFEIDNELDAIIAQSKSLKEENPVEKEERKTEAEPEDLKELVNKIKKKAKKQAIVTKIEKEIAPKKEIKAKKETKKPLENISFTEWLQNKKSIDASKAKLEKKPLKKETEEVPLDFGASNEAALIMEAKKSSFKLEDFLVDQIERKQERKEKNTRNFTHAVSETYAKILENQGNIQGAINVYKELSIKYPKKSSNFATRIDNLKNSL